MTKLFDDNEYVLKKIKKKCFVFISPHPAGVAVRAWPPPTRVESEELALPVEELHEDSSPGWSHLDHPPLYPHLAGNSYVGS